MTKKETKRGTFGTGHGYATDLGPVLEARYNNHSGAKARERLRAKLNPPMGPQTGEEHFKQNVEGTYDRLTPEQQIELNRRLIAAFTGPKAEAMNNMALKIRDNPGIDEYSKAALFAQLVHWASSEYQS